MPRAKKQDTLPEFEPEYDGQYLTDNEEDLEPKDKKQSHTPKRKYRKRTHKGNTTKTKSKKGKKGTKSKKEHKPPKQENQYQSNVLNSATKMKQMLNINQARLKVHFVPKGILTGVKSAKAKKGIKGKKYTKSVKLPKALMDKIKEAQQVSKQDKHSTIIPGYKLGKCPKCGKVHMLPAEVANKVSGYESDNENEMPQIKQTEEHHRKTGLVYTSTTTNGKTTDTGHYIIDNSNNNAIVKGLIKDGKRTEMRIPRK
jgi:hypothetical protein